MSIAKPITVISLIMLTMMISTRLAFAVTISDISVSDISETSAAIVWTTDDETASNIDYGTSEDYTLSSSDSNYVTSHSLSLSGLTKGTTYHYKIISSNSDGESAETEDATFTTSGGSSSSSSSPTSAPTGTPIPTATPTPTPDIIPPSITIKTDLSDPFEFAPDITGTASDTSGVKQIEYSLDNGSNWIGTSLAKQGSSTTTFTFKPEGLEDGDYVIKIRGTDEKGNTGIAKPVSLVIDRLPPLLGTQVMSIGPHLFYPGPDGFISLIVGQTPTYTISAVGGPSSITLTSEKLQQDQNIKKDIQLQKNVSGFWQTSLQYTEPADYRLTLSAIDGAKHATTKETIPIHALSPGIITDQSGHPISHATIMVWVYDDDTKRYTPWDAKAYGQDNPHITDARGSYGWILPAGSYYLQISSPGYITLTTPLFTIHTAQQITKQFALTSHHGFSLWKWFIPLPPFSQTSDPVSITSTDSTSTKSDMIGKSIPILSLQDTIGSPITNISLRGSPTLVTFLSTWSPATASQLPILESLAKTYRILIIFPQETQSSIRLYQSRGDYHVQMAADPDGTTIDAFQLHTVPTHLFLDTHGIVTNLYTGILTEEAISKNMLQ